MIAIAHRNGKSKCSDETDDHGRYKGSGDNDSSVRALLSQMNRSIQTGVDEVGINKSTEEYNGIRRPSRGVFEFAPNSLVVLFRVRFGDASNGDDEEGDDRHEDYTDQLRPSVILILRDT